MTEIKAPQPAPVNDGGPAFPLVAESHEHVLSVGVTLRDYFAAKALPAAWIEMDGNMAHEEAISRSADIAYKLADAMLKARGGAA